jgi:regulator of replication initiation timing
MSVEPSAPVGVPDDALLEVVGEAPGPAAPADITRAQAQLADEMDELSLRQALVDFEVANARTRDLTQRLVALVEDNHQLEHELAEVRDELVKERALIAEQRGSQAYKLASRIWNLRNALRG